MPILHGKGVKNDKINLPFTQLLEKQFMTGKRFKRNACGCAQLPHRKRRRSSGRQDVDGMPYLYDKRSQKVMQNFLKKATKALPIGVYKCSDTPCKALKPYGRKVALLRFPADREFFARKFRICGARSGRQESGSCSKPYHCTFYGLTARPSIPLYP